MAEGLQLPDDFLELLGIPDKPEPTPESVLKFLVTRCKGKAKIGQLARNFHWRRRIAPWLEEHSERFAVFEDDNEQPHMAAVCLPGARLCTAYVTPGETCRDEECSRFHICRRHVGGICREAMCTMDHNLRHEHNQTVIQQLELGDFSEDELVNIICCSSLQVCGYYNWEQGLCPNEDRCVRIHVCQDFVKGTCQTDEECGLSHSFDKPHARRLLRSYGLTGKPEEEIKSQLILFHRRGPVRRKPRQMGLERIVQNFRPHAEGNVKDSDDDDSEDECERAFKMLSGGVKSSIAGKAFNPLLHPFFRKAEKVKDSGKPESDQVKADEAYARMLAEAQDSGSDEDLAGLMIPERKVKQNPLHRNLFTRVQSDKGPNADTAMSDEEMARALAAEFGEMSQEDLEMMWKVDRNKDEDPALTDNVDADVTRLTEPEEQQHDDDDQADTIQDNIDLAGLDIDDPEFQDEPQPYDDEVIPNPTDSTAVATKLHGKRITWTRGKVPQDNFKYICAINLAGACDNESCDDFHFRRPFLWHVKLEDKWYNLNNANCEIEETFCDPVEEEYITELPPGSPKLQGKLLKISFLKLEGEILSQEGISPTISVRRLSTRSYGDPEALGNLYATQWIWWGQDGSGRWKRIDKQIQKKLEERYLKFVRGGKTYANFAQEDTESREKTKYKLHFDRMVLESDAAHHNACRRPKYRS